MSIQDIAVVAVSYNSAELLQGMLASLRRFYPNRVHVVDGSDAEHLPAIQEVAAGFEDVELHAMGYNIHHGPGMAWAIQHLGLSGRVLFLDTDIVVLREGFLEALNEALRPGDYGAGGVAYVNREGFDIAYGYGAVPYLHPPCMLCNIEVMRQWPLPIKHGAPMVAPMLALHDAGRSDLLRNLDWAKNDVLMGTRKVYVDHIGKGTSTATGGYHLEEWMAEVQTRQAAKAAQPPAQGYNPDLLALIPTQARTLIEVGCSTGSLAHALKRQRPEVHYLGLELDPKAAEIAAQHCDGMVSLDIEGADESLYRDYADRDCWIFGDVLEHLRDPWRVLGQIRKVLPEGGCVVASVPNVQHWSVQGRLSVGDFRYEGTGLLDRTHLRWFTRVTLFELFQSAGLRIEAGVPRIFDEPGREPVLAAIRQMAIAMGRDPEGAVRDALPLQYVVRAVRA
ncbi:bifunctional glycosyltransferase/class I SAM-dependent methyltransferase [Paucibacter sp. XJ19-41]|uniref:bifunctional glycosyltransferase/class I SAM-dependent methyltransferase n=1 Tax=Paucibacter sp. XJ19-41 TaxID=2927824 RepID=UPI00234B0A3F|nr:bifunctional glycosyltransferase/class I SAM-dependent methyltransferase [Paucibacter sp. XJ19-41]MDC6171052.1 bifunctional glycosyltransferase/class I SAM-dependent methyltransferase [Paucibacter sp. XJ19-41]